MMGVNFKSGNRDGGNLRLIKRRHLLICSRVPEKKANHQKPTYKTYSHSSLTFQRADLVPVAVEMLPDHDMSLRFLS